MLLRAASFWVSTGCLFQLHIVLEEGKGFAVVGMGVQIETQLLDHKVQGAQLVQVGVRQLRCIHL